MQTQTDTCGKCGHSIAYVMEKALNGESALVWMDTTGDWICEHDGDEHSPASSEETAAYMRDLDTVTEGMRPSALGEDSVFNDVVDAMENKGHPRTRVAHTLREWILWGDADPVEDEEGEESPMDPVEAVSYAILAINDATEPQATSGNDRLYLECNAERAIAALARIRDYLIASGEDLPDYVFGKGE